MYCGEYIKDVQEYMYKVASTETDPSKAWENIPRTNHKQTSQQPTNRLSNIPQLVSQQTTTEHTTKQYTANRKQ